MCINNIAQQQQTNALLLLEVKSQGKVSVGRDGSILVIP
jgi:hypothetical protein